MSDRTEGEGRTLILGCRGQLGRALASEFPGADSARSLDLDVTDSHQMSAWPWHRYSLVLNAAAFTEVDAAETSEGRRLAWATNASAPATLARLAGQHGFTLIHYSSDYVFDGSEAPHVEAEPFSPLGVYGQSKAAGDIAVSLAPRHYLIRTSWVVGEGRNFVRTMQSLAASGANPRVVDDQVGQLTFTSTLARGTRHLHDIGAPFGTYNLTNAGSPTSWAALARQVFQLSGRSGSDVSPVSTEEYYEGRAFAPRPLLSALDLTKIRAAGFEPEDATSALQRYLTDAI